MWSVFLLAFAAAAPTPAATAAVATEAVVQRLQEHYDTTADFTAKVTQEMTVASLGRTLETHGSVYFKRPGRMRWELQNHHREIIVADGENLWVYRPDDKQAFKAPFDRAFQSTTPISFLTGIGRISDDFAVEADGTAGDIIYLRLRPRVATELGTLRLGIDRETYDVREAEIDDPLGNITRLHFSDIKRDVGLKDDLFEFDVPRGTEVMEVPTRR